MIPGCVGRGVRLGSEGSSGGATGGGGVWKSGTWKSGNLEIWGPGNPEIWRSGDLEIQKLGVQKIEKIKILKIQIRSAQNVGKVWLVGNKSSRPHLGPSQAFFPWTGKNKILIVCLFPLVGQWALFTWFGPLLLSTRGGEIGE